MTHTTQAPQHGAPATVPRTPGKGLLILLAIVVVSAFLALSHALGAKEVWAAFLFLLYWAAIEHAKLERLPACIVGGAVGLLMGYLLQTLPVALGEVNGGLLFLAAVLIMVYCHVMAWVVVAVNVMTMLFLTVATIPAITSAVDFGGAFIALALGVAYFAGLVWLGQRWQARKSSPA
jgi:hypothetical protein